MEAAMLVRFRNGMALPSIRYFWSGFPSICALFITFVFMLGGAAASYRERVLHVFAGGSDGAAPYAALIADKNGNLYGTTNSGGGSCSCGTVFKLAPDGTETILHAFAGHSDGSYPLGGLLADKAGDVFGTTFGGNGWPGTVFELASDG